MNKDIKFKINAIDNARTRAINFALMFGWALLAGLMVLRMVIALLIGV